MSSNSFGVYLVNSSDNDILNNTANSNDFGGVYIGASFDCSGSPEKIEIKKAGDHQVTISFTGDNGYRYDDVHLDQGPIRTGELFIVGGIVYEFTEAKSDPDNSGQIKIKIRNVRSSEEISTSFIDMSSWGSNPLNVNYDTFDGEAKSTSTTLNYVPVASGSDSQGYINFKNVGSIPVTYDGSRLYLAKSGDVIGMDSGIVGVLNDFQNEDNPMNVSVISENGTDINGDNDINDSLILVSLDSGEVIYIDFYDKNYGTGTTNDTNEDWDNRVSIEGNSNGVLDGKDNGDVLWTPIGADEFIIYWNDDNEINSVDLCHPQTKLNPAYSNNNRIINNTLISNRYGIIMLSYSSNNTLQENEISRNHIGIYSQNSNSTISSNFVCNNEVLDFDSFDWQLSSGDNNTCSKPDKWNDNNSSGCTYECPCKAVYDDMYINGDIILCSGSYDIYDIESNGVLIINSSNIVLDCNNSILNGNNSGYGIYLENKSNVTIRNCNVAKYNAGIYLNDSSGNIIADNALNSNEYGILLDMSSNNRLTNNTANSNNLCGISLKFSHNNTIFKNTLNSNDYGICLRYSSNNNLTDNTANSNNNIGIGIASLIECSGGTEKIEIKKVGTHQVTISFTDDNGDRYDDVHLDQGPIKTGELFMVGGIVYEFKEAKNDPDVYGEIKVKIKDASSSEEISTNFINKNPAGYTKPLTLNYDTFSGESKVTESTLHYAPSNGTMSIGSKTVPVSWDGSRLYLATDAVGSAKNVGVNKTIVGVLNNFQNEDNPMNVSVILENSTDINGDNDANDSLMVVKIHSGEVIYLDFYDKNYDTGTTNDTDDDWDNRVSIEGNPDAVLDDEDEGNTLSAPVGGDEFVVDYGSSDEIIGVTICHPQTMFDSSHSNNLIANNTINSNDYGIHLYHSSNNTLRENKISNNTIGIYSQNSNSTINSNTVCGNINLDFNSSGWQGSSGTNNVCSTGNWNDTGTAGCTLTCKQYLCDLNNDGLITQDYNDLMSAYNCFLGVTRDCNEINSGSWAEMKSEYECFSGV